MKRTYESPLLTIVEVVEGIGIMDSASYKGELEPEEGTLGKQNSLTWNDEVEDLWGDDSEEGK